VIEANYITKREDKLAITSLTDEDIKEIITLSKDPKIGDRVRLNDFICYPILTFWNGLILNRLIYLSCRQVKPTELLPHLGQPNIIYHRLRIITDNYYHH
jgi:hypothetical protein